MPTACQPDPQKGPQIANPARLPGHQRARYQESWHTKIIYRGRVELTALFADSGLSVRLYRTDEDTAVEDPATGVFGTGDDLPAAVQDFQDALQDHLNVLAGEDALAPPLQRQLEILRSYFDTP